jgi:hypothetical protein
MRRKIRCLNKKLEIKKPKRNEAESLHTTRLRKENSKDCVPIVNGADPDTSWLIMGTVTHADIAV